MQISIFHFSEKSKFEESRKKIRFSTKSDEFFHSSQQFSHFLVGHLPEVIMLVAKECFFLDKLFFRETKTFLDSSRLNHRIFLENWGSKNYFYWNRRKRTIMTGKQKNLT